MTLINKTFEATALATYDETRTSGKDHTITALYVELGVSVIEAALVFEQLDAGIDIDLNRVTIEAFKKEKGLT